MMQYDMVRQRYGQCRWWREGGGNRHAIILFHLFFYFIHISVILFFIFSDFSLRSVLLFHSYFCSINFFLHFSIIFIRMPGGFTTTSSTPFVSARSTGWSEPAYTSTPPWSCMKKRSIWLFRFV